MLKMLSFGMNTRPEMFVSLTHCVGDTSIDVITQCK